jgi:hypothetical protein
VRLEWSKAYREWQHRRLAISQKQPTTTEIQSMRMHSEGIWKLFVYQVSCVMCTSLIPVPNAQVCVYLWYILQNYN